MLIVEEHFFLRILFIVFLCNEKIRLLPHPRDPH